MKFNLTRLLHVGIWLLGYIIVGYSIKTLGVFSKNDESLWLPITFGTIINLIIFYSTALWVIPKYTENRKIVYFLKNCTLVFLGFSILETLIDYLFFTNMYSTASIDQTFSSQLYTNAALNLFFLVTALAYGFIRVYLIQEKRKQELISEKLSAELDFLKTQVHPHFLFNVLNMAYASSTVYGDEKTAQIIEHLAKLMRYMLYESNSPFVSLEKEVDYLKSYVQLQQLRFTPEIQSKIAFKVEGVSESHQIAPLLLIPFIENAFKHSVFTDKESHIFISLRVKKKQLQLDVENSMGTAHTFREDSGGIGLKNVYKRLKLIYPNEHSLCIDNDGKLHRVSLSIELHNQL